MQRDGVRHDLRHQVHDFVFEIVAHHGVAIEKLDPDLHGQMRHACFGHCANRVRRGRAQSPRRVAGIHVVLFGKAQDHFLAFLVRDDAFQHAIEDEVLRHVVFALAQQQIAFLVVADVQETFEIGERAGLQGAQDDVPGQLLADGFALRMADKQAHECPSKAVLTGIKAGCKSRFISCSDSNNCRIEPRVFCTLDRHQAYRTWPRCEGPLRDDPKPTRARRRPWALMNKRR